MRKPSIIVLTILGTIGVVSDLHALELCKDKARVTVTGVIGGAVDYELDRTKQLISVANMPPPTPCDMSTIRLRATCPLFS
jgi:hypothetical protein